MNVQNYNNTRGIYSPLVEHNGIACGFWLCGNDYRNPSNYYGAYPPSYLKRMAMLFPTEIGVLHLFSGMVKKGHWFDEYTCDINPELRPDITCDALNLSQAISERKLYGYIDLILADPPYDNNHEKYGTAKVNKRLVLKQCVKVLNPGGYLVWLDTIIPMWSKADGWSLKGTIGLVQSTNHKCRVITILKKGK